MKWTYKQDRLVSSALNPIDDFIHFLRYLSWSYAHYINGRGPKFTRKGFFSEMRSAWSEAKHRNDP